MDKHAKEFARALEISGVKSTALAQTVGVDPSYISQWKTGRRPIPADKAPIVAAVLNTDAASISRLYEEVLSASPDWPQTARLSKETEICKNNDKIAAGYVRFQHLDVNAGAGSGVINEDFPAVVRVLEVREEEALALTGKRQTGNIYVAGIANDSMEPTLNPRDLVFIDTAINRFEGDGIYFFVYDSLLFCKRLQKLPGGRIAVISDNSKYKEWSIDGNDPTPWQIVAKVLSVLPLKVSAFA